MDCLKAIQIPWKVQSITLDFLKWFSVMIRFSIGEYSDGSSLVNTNGSLSKLVLSTEVEMHTCISNENPLLTRGYDGQVAR